MDSQVTLSETLSVAPGPLPSQFATYLAFSQDSVKNCTIHNYDDGVVSSDPLYTVKSNASYSQTVVRDAMEETPLAVIKRSDFRADKIALRGSQPCKMNQWLRPLKLLRTFPITFEERGQTYVWKCAIDGRLSLHNANALEEPIAWLMRAPRAIPGLSPRPNRRPILVLEPEALTMQDRVVISFLILEHKSRMMMKKQDIHVASLSHGRAL